MAMTNLRIRGSLTHTDDKVDVEIDNRLRRLSMKTQRTVRLLSELVWTASGDEIWMISFACGPRSRDCAEVEMRVVSGGL